MRHSYRNGIRPGRAQPALELGELLRSFTGHAKGPGSAAFSPCGAYVATGSEDGAVRLWESGIDEE